MSSKQEQNKRLGVVLEGGALRGLFSAGVIDALMELDIMPDGVVGVSAGAAFGCNYKSQQPGRVIRYNKRLAHDWRYCSLRSWLTTGDLFGSEFCYHTLPDELDLFDTATFDASPMEFYAVCTDVLTGRPVYKLLMHHSRECYDWIRASASMPIASKIVEIRGQKLLDGGVTDSIPLSFFEQQGYKRNIVVLTQPRGYRKKPNPLLPLIRISLRKYPAFVQAMNRRHLMYNQQLDHVFAEEKAGHAFVILPEDNLGIGHTSHDPDEMQHTYDLGRKAVEQCRGALEAFIAR